MSTRLMESLAATDALSLVFSDASVLQAMLDFEGALARAQASVGLIPGDAARVIADAARADGFDTAELARLAFRAGTPAIPLVRMLTDRVRASDPGAARFVHWGATSQDVADTALVLLLRRCRDILAADQARLERALREVSNQHAGSVMLGRTLLQPAPPVTFGLKAAGWLAAIRRGWSRVAGRFGEAMVLQFGGASGTLAALQDRGLAVSEAFAADLGLACPDAPWHAYRDRLAALLAALSIYTGSLGKMALDLALLMQFEVSEAAERGGEGRGGSSTMPHKRNPTGCTLAVAAAHRVPGLLANFLSGLLQEHERAAGAWQAEWPLVEGIVQSAGVALASMGEAAEGLIVFPERMRRNLESTRGAVFAERAMMLLAPGHGRERAHQLLDEAVSESSSSGRSLGEVLAGMEDVTRVLTEAEIRNLESPEDYLGSAEMFRTRLLGLD